VRRHERRRAQLGDVPEAALVQVREIDEDPHAVARPHELAARGRQARTGVRRAGEPERYTLGEGVGTAPDEAEGAQARTIEHLEGVELGIDRVRALEVEDRGHRPAVEAGPELVDVTDHLELAG
jgi:hypothetical protein